MGKKKDKPGFFTELGASLVMLAFGISDKVEKGIKEIKKGI